MPARVDAQVGAVQGGGFLPSRETPHPRLDARVAADADEEGGEEETDNAPRVIGAATHFAPMGRIFGASIF